MHGESRIATRACPTMDKCDTSVLTPCRKSSIVVLSPRLSEPRAEAVRHIERLWFRHTTGSGGGGRYGLCWRSEELPTLDGDERSVPLVHPPGLTHHFLLSFPGFSWKIQDIHMRLREQQCAVLVTTLSESRKTVGQKSGFAQDTKLPI